MARRKVSMLKRRPRRNLRRLRRKSVRSRRVKTSALRVTTFQHDSRQVYKSSSSKRAVVVAKRRSRNAFNHVLASECTLNGSIAFSGAGDGQQYWMVVGNAGLCGAGGANGSGDLGYVASQCGGFVGQSVVAATSTGPTQYDTGDLQLRLLFQKVRYRFTLYNPRNGPIFISHYVCYARRDVDIDPLESGVDSFSTYYGSAFNAQGANTLGSTFPSEVGSSRFGVGPAQLLQPATIGVTPFQNSPFCTRFKIASVRNYHIPAVDKVEIEATEVLNYVTTLQGMNGLLGKRGVTSCHVFICNQFPVGGIASNAPTITLERTYIYKYDSTRPLRRTMPYSAS